MRRRPTLIVFGSLIALLCVIGVVRAQSSPNFDMTWGADAGGGGERQSTNFVIQDTVGQLADGVSTSANAQVVAGFIQDFSAISGPLAGDAFEDDDACNVATVIDTAGTKQTHTFHNEGDQDWLRFTAQANKTYIIEIKNLGAKANAIVLLQDACDLPPAGQGSNSFGTTVRLEWDSTKDGDFFVKLQQFDPSFSGPDANYEVSVAEDTKAPAAPLSPRCFAINTTTLGLQWTQSPERDVVRYRIQYTGGISGNEDVFGKATTTYELKNLAANDTYQWRVSALDFSGHEGAQSGEVVCTTKDPVDTTAPVLNLAHPTSSNVYSTTASSLTFSGQAQDTGNNLSRVNVHNNTANKDGWDYGLSGSSDDFRVTDLGLSVGDNNVQITVYDSAGNTSQQPITVRRLGQVSGAALIIAGHNETFGLQTNIYNAANRAYRIFESAGYTDDDIYYIAPTPQDVDGDGGNKVDATSSRAAIENAITTWAKEGGRVGPDKPFFIYMVDHGLVEKFCASGCDAGGQVTPADIDGWLRQLETDTGANQINVVIEACQSGSFIDRFGGDVANSLSKAGRVIITATGRENNAYASAQGAYFSDAFFSCVADSNNLKSCYEEGVTAVEGTGVNQTPWLDDNGDGLSNSGDGTVAQGRVVTRFFSSIRPKIGQVSLDQAGANGTLTAQVSEGAEDLTLVWAAVFPPSFEEPSNVTLNLNVPTVRLEPVPDQAGQYSFAYTNGFTEEGDYRVVFYAQDRLGINAVPKREDDQSPLLLPMISYAQNQLGVSAVPMGKGENVLLRLPVIMR